jgi:hypothetical protein
VIRFNLMCAHTIYSPASRNSTRSYIMARCNASLPIQDDIGGVTPRICEANIEKCLRGEIGTRNVDGVRSTSSDSRPVESQGSHD